MLYHMNHEMSSNNKILPACDSDGSDFDYMWLHDHQNKMVYNEVTEVVEVTLWKSIPYYSIE